MEDGGDLAEGSAAADVKAAWSGVGERAARSWRQHKGPLQGLSPQRAVPAEPREGFVTQLQGRESGDLLHFGGFPGGGREHPKNGRV